MRDRQRLIARIKQTNRALAEPDASGATPVQGGTDTPSEERIRALEVRVAHLEDLLEGLQDSVYREAQRQNTRTTDLEARLEPEALASELSRHTRERGL